MTDFNVVGTIGEPVNPIGERMLHGVGHDLREVVESGISADTYRIDEDSGNGTVDDDLNNTDFTAQTGTTFLYLEKQIVYTFIHKVVLYSWVGLKDRNLGVGGNLIALPPDLIAQGTADHNLLVNRNSPSAHEPEDITGLVSEQSAQDAATAQVASDLTTHYTATPAHGTEHIDGLNADQAAQDQALADHKTGPDEHPTSSIIGLDADQITQDNALQAHLDDATQGAHDQFATKVDVLENFVAVGYGGLHANAQGSLPDLGAGWVTFEEWDGIAVATPKLVVQDVAGQGFRLDRIGVWMLSLKLALSHNEAQSGREISMRLYNATTATPGPTEFVYGVGRNVGATNMTVPGIIWEVGSLGIGDLIQIQLGGGDSFSSVVNLGGFLNATHISEAQGL